MDQDFRYQILIFMKFLMTISINAKKFVFVFQWSSRLYNVFAIWQNN